ncbi:Zinc finger, CCHC-type [Sesbania bispinosa]|nr:Zinc finger, CCHC-type [Sesbania bispinosa]
MANVDGDDDGTKGLSAEEEDLLLRSTKKSMKGDAPFGYSGRKVISYKDVCLGVNGGDDGYESSEKEFYSWEDVDDDVPVDSEEMEIVEEDNFKILCPTVRLTKSERIGACIPWKRAIIVKLLGKSVSLRFLQGRLQKLWQPAGRMEVIDIDNDYFVVRFMDWSDLNKVYDGGPWLIMGHYLVMQRRRPEFQPFEEAFKRVSVWIRVPGLPIEYYDGHILWRIGDVVGHTIKIDPNTLRQHEDEQGANMITERGRFARICVEVDLRKVLIARFKLNGKIYHVEYEGLHLICFNCGCFGHRKEHCPLLVEASKESEQPNDESNSSENNGGGNQRAKDGGPATEECFGPWMMVQRKSRGRITQRVEIDSQGKKIKEVVNVNHSPRISGSRFSLLEEQTQVNEVGTEDTMMEQNNDVVIEESKKVKSNLEKAATVPILANHIPIINAQGGGKSNAKKACEVEQTVPPSSLRKIKDTARGEKRNLCGNQKNQQVFMSPAPPSSNEGHAAEKYDMQIVVSGETRGHMDGLPLVGSTKPNGEGGSGDIPWAQNGRPPEQGGSEHNLSHQAVLLGQFSGKPPDDDAIMVDSGQLNAHVEGKDNDRKDVVPQGSTPTLGNSI